VISLATRVDQNRYKITRGLRLPEVAVSLKMALIRVQYSILKQYGACGDVMVHNQPHVDTEFFIKNDSYVKFGTPYAEYFL